MFVSVTVAKMCFIKECSKHFPKFTRKHYEFLDIFRNTFLTKTPLVPTLLFPKRDNQMKNFFFYLIKLFITIKLLRNKFNNLSGTNPHQPPDIKITSLLFWTFDKTGTKIPNAFATGCVLMPWIPTASVPTTCDSSLVSSLLFFISCYDIHNQNEN